MDGIHSFDDGFEAARNSASKLEFFSLVDAPDEPIPFELPGCTHKMEETSFKLSIDEGQVYLHCAKDGNQPEWLEEWRDHLSMGDMLVTIKNDNDRGQPGYCGCDSRNDPCDCGPDFQITRAIVCRACDGEGEGGTINPVVRFKCDVCRGTGAEPMQEDDDAVS